MAKISNFDTDTASYYQVRTLSFKHVCMKEHKTTNSFLALCTDEFTGAKLNLIIKESE